MIGSVSPGALYERICRNSFINPCDAKACNKPIKDEICEMPPGVSENGPAVEPRRGQNERAPVLTRSPATRSSCRSLCLIYRMMADKYPGYLVILSDQKRILASSDRPEAMPPQKNSILIAVFFAQAPGDAGRS